MSGRVLQLGCGVRPLEGGAVNHDRVKHAPHVDVAHDLNILPWPWDDEQFTKVIALDVLEHLKLDVEEWLAECWRILEPDGELVMRLPAWDNPVSHRDPTHVRFFHEETFDYWDPGKPLHRDYGHYYFTKQCWWRVESVERVNADPRYGIGDLGFVLRKLTDG